MMRNMRLSIFGRLVIGYLVLFSMLAGLSLYFIYQLGLFNRITRSIILKDTSALEFSNQLTDALLTEARNDRKYVVLKDEELYRSSLQARKEFNQLLDNALQQNYSEEVKHIFYTINVQHRNFSQLVDVERQQLQASKPYSPDWYAEEKKKVADDIIEQLKNIRVTSEKNVFAKIVQLQESGDRARYFAIIISMVALSTGLVVAFVITRSIKKPLDVMRAKTVQISHGNFHGDLDVKSPPVIADLASAINTMCHKLQEVDDMKSGFFSHMSHELRTPLASIKEGSIMLMDGLGGEITEKQQRILRIIIEESNRMIEQVNSLLDLAKMEAGMLKYNFVATDLQALIQKTVRTLKPLAETKKITVENTIEILQPVKIDQERIEQVFRNIIGNAIKFTPENGRIKLQAEIRNSFVEVAVQDTGMGIPEEELERIFFKFQQVIPAKGAKTKGTGLGLATVKQIIIAHGGKVWATSQVGRGSTFYITLPLV